MSAGKRNEANSISPDLISKVEEFCTSNYFEEQFEAFARENMKIFRSSVDMKDGEEQPIEFFEVYRKYLDKFEKLIEDFIAKNGYSCKEFYLKCKEIMETTDLFGSRRFFIESMLALSEYDTFLMLMKGEVRQYSSKK